MDRLRTRKIQAIALLGAMLSVSTLVNASEFTGTVQTLRLSQAAPAPPATPRVSILVGPHNSPCSVYPEWYSFESADSGIGKIWLAALMAAQASGRSVRIMGTGTCDSYGLEIVSYIDAL